MKRDSEIDNEDNQIYLPDEIIYIILDFSVMVERSQIITHVPVIEDLYYYKNIVITYFSVLLVNSVYNRVGKSLKIDWLLLYTKLDGCAYYKVLRIMDCIDI